MGQQRPGCLGALLGLLSPAGSQTGPAAESGANTRTDVYRLRDDFLSPAELSFFRVLQLAAGSSFVVLAKVGLGDLFYVTRPNENQAARSRISQKHVDFVLCDPATLKPLLALELDDASHRKPDAIERDRFKDAVFAAAGLPLLRIPAARAYEPAQLRTMLDTALAPNREDPPRPAAPLSPDPDPAPAPDSVDAPTCPKCAVPMTLRTARRGENAGETFWGCPNYPRCRHTKGEA